jgi:hypothetical protein
MACQSLSAQNIFQHDSHQQFAATPHLHGISPPRRTLEIATSSNRSEHDSRQIQGGFIAH